MTSEYGAPSDMVYKDTLRAEEYRRTIENLAEVCCAGASASARTLPRPSFSLAVIKKFGLKSPSSVTESSTVSPGL